MLLMTSYLVSIATASHQTHAKMCLNNTRTATENSSCWFNLFNPNSDKRLISPYCITT